MRDLGYLREAHRESLGVARDAAELLSWVNAYEHPRSKWTRTAADALQAGSDRETDRL
jgi:hypothetical protein